MNNETSGSCLCGKVNYKVEGGLESFFLCHCKYCQKDTGSAHAANLFYSNSKLNWTSGEELVRTFNLPKTRHIKSFCSSCGAALPSIQDEGRLTVVPAGSVDFPISMRPNAHLFIASKANWDANLEDVQTFERLP